MCSLIQRIWSHLYGPQSVNIEGNDEGDEDDMDEEDESTEDEEDYAEEETQEAPQSRPGSAKSSLTPSHVDLLHDGVDPEGGKSTGINKLFTANPISQMGKRIQLLRMVGITMVPISILLALVGTIFFLRLNEFLKAQDIRRILRFSVEISELVDNLQKERDFSAIYSSSIGVATKSYLVERYPLTDAAIQSLTDWEASDDNHLTYFQSKEKFQNYLNRHRYELDSNHPTEKDELAFYSEIIQIFMKWFYDAITETSSGTVWKLLVALQETMEAKEKFGIERAFGSIYYITGGFQSREDYLIFAESQDVANATLYAARQFSADVEGVYQESVTDEQQRLFEVVIREYQYEIRFNPFPKNMTGSVQLAKYWSDNMTLYVDVILSIQRTLTQRIYDDLLETEQTDQLILTVLGVVVVFVVIMCPGILNAVYALTSQIQGYSVSLAERTKALHKEKKRTETLLYQMLPKSVAEKLKKNENVGAEHYSDVTVFFSDVEDFTRISARSSPIQVVNMLDNLYTRFDNQIQLYDVYKVETIGDAYMVASGLPNPNGSRHASEIAMMSLDLLQLINTLEIPHMPGTIFRMRIGIHTGAVVAGIVGTKMPRYCLFGETVIIASQMEQTGIAGRIQISNATFQALSEHSEFVMVPRDNAPPNLKNSGIKTYWLKHRKGMKMHSKREDSENDLDINTTDSDGEHRDHDNFYMHDKSSKKDHTVVKMSESSGYTYNKVYKS